LLMLRLREQVVSLWVSVPSFVVGLIAKSLYELMYSHNKHLFRTHVLSYLTQITSSLNWPFPFTNLDQSHGSWSSADEWETPTSKYSAKEYSLYEWREYEQWCKELDSITIHEMKVWLSVCIRQRGLNRCYNFVIVHRRKIEWAHSPKGPQHCHFVWYVKFDSLVSHVSNYFSS
jgi:hypothetical protein